MVPWVNQSPHPNGISLGSAVFCRAQDCDRPTDRQTDRPCCNNRPHPHLHSSEMRPCAILQRHMVLTGDTVSVKFITSIYIYELSESPLGCALLSKFKIRAVKRLFFNHANRSDYFFQSRVNAHVRHAVSCVKTAELLSRYSFRC